ncbi:MAG: outer membrane lipoprotein carrier protein LolA [Cytophagaceae bacterium]
MPKFRIVLFFILLSGPLFAQPPGFKVLTDTAGFRSSLAAAAKEIKTIESDFVQEKNLSVLSEKIISKGHFIFKKENKLRWEYNHPFKYLIVMNNNKVLIKDENKENKYDMKSNKLFQEINSLMINSVQGNILNNKDYKPAFFYNDNYFLVQLFPQNKNLKGFLQSIDLYFDKKDLSVTKIIMAEPSGDYTNITFSAKKFNGEIADEKFNIK